MMSGTSPQNTKLTSKFTQTYRFCPVKYREGSPKSFASQKLYKQLCNLFKFCYIKFVYNSTLLVKLYQVNEKAYNLMLFLYTIMLSVCIILICCFHRNLQLISIGR